MTIHLTPAATEPVTLPALPMERDTMEAYVTERAPHMGAFTFFPRSEVYGYASLYRRPFLADMEAVGDLRSNDTARSYTSTQRGLSIDDYALRAL